MRLTDMLTVIVKYTENVLHIFWMLFVDNKLSFWLKCCMTQLILTKRRISTLNTAPNGENRTWCARFLHIDWMRKIFKHIFHLEIKQMLFRTFQKYHNMGVICGVFELSPMVLIFYYRCEIYSQSGVFSQFVLFQQPIIHAIFTI